MRPQELNRLIDEQLQMPFPTAPARRRTRGGGPASLATAAHSKPSPAPIPATPPAERVDNNPVKAREGGEPGEEVEAGGEALAPTRELRETGSAGTAGRERDVATPATDGGHPAHDGGEVGEEISARSKSPEQASSFFGKFGGAVLSLVGRPAHQKDENADDKEGDEEVEEWKLSAPGDYPLSEVQSPMENGHDLEPERGLGSDLAAIHQESEQPSQDAQETHDREYAGPDGAKPHANSDDGADDDDSRDHESDGENEDAASASSSGNEAPGDADEEEQPDEPNQIPNMETDEDGARRRMAPSDHDPEEDFDMSGTEAIPGTMTHGMDQPEMLTPLGERHLDASLIDSGDYLGAVDILETVFEEDSTTAESPSWEPFTAQHGNQASVGTPTAEHDERPEVQGHQDRGETSGVEEIESLGGVSSDRHISRRNIGYDIASPASSAFISEPDNYVESVRLESDEAPVAGEGEEDREDEGDEEEDDEDPDETLVPAVSWDAAQDLSGDITLEHHGKDRDSPDPEEAREPHTPTEGLLPSGIGVTQPFIEYVPAVDSGTDVPEQLQDPPIARHVGAGPDVHVSQIGASLSPPGFGPGSLRGTGDAGTEELDESLVLPSDLKNEDPGLHDGLADNIGTPDVAESTGSDYPTPWFSTADSESQAFVTPLPSTGFQSPPSFDETHEPRGWHQHDALFSEFQDRDLGAATVQGQDNLFDDSNESAGSESADGVLAERDEEDTHPGSDPGEENGHDDTYAEDPPQHTEVVTADATDNAEDAAAEPETTRSIGQGSTSLTIDSGYRSETPGNELRDLANQPHGEAAEPEHRQATPQLTPQVVQEQATPDISPISLRQSAPSTPFRGLADSRHAPPRAQDPVTPPRQTWPRPDAGADDDVGADPFAPRDVTHVPWHSRTDSTPLSLHSQTTLSSSSPPSPIHAALAADNHEPVIRDSWPAPVHQNLLARMAAGESPGRRPRTDSLGGQSDYDAFRYEPSGGAKSPLATRWAAASTRQLQLQQPEPPVTPPASQRNSVVGGGPSSSPSSLFQKMRSIFEQPGTDADAAGRTDGASPRSRPVSGVWYSVGGKQDRSGEAGEGDDDGDDDGPPDRKSVV